MIGKKDTNNDCIVLLEKTKTTLNNVVGLIDQATYSGQKNTVIFYNVYGYLGNLIGEIEQELETQKLNSETPQKGG